MSNHSSKFCFFAIDVVSDDTSLSSSSSHHHQIFVYSIYKMTQAHHCVRLNLKLLDFSVIYNKPLLIMILQESYSTVLQPCKPPVTFYIQFNKRRLANRRTS